MEVGHAVDCAPLRCAASLCVALIVLFRRP
jgi:hypothetical protein